MFGFKLPGTKKKGKESNKPIETKKNDDEEDDNYDEDNEDDEDDDEYIRKFNKGYKQKNYYEEITSADIIPSDKEKTNILNFFSEVTINTNFTIKFLIASFTIVYFFLTVFYSYKLILLLL